MEFYRTTPRHDLTYSDVFLVPSRSGVTSRLDVSLAPDDGSGASVPLVSANMNSITGPRLAATLARRGGLPQGQPVRVIQDVTTMETRPEAESFQGGLQGERSGPPNTYSDDLHGST